MSTFDKQKKFEQIVHRVYPDARLLDFRSLEGGVSAQITALEFELPNKGRQRLVVRQYGDADLQADPNIAVHEFQLLQLVHSKGLPVPKSLYADESNKILSSPYLVVEYVDGQTVDEPADVVSFVHQMADVLARIHAIDANKDIAFLPDQEAVFTAKLSKKPAQPDESLSEGRIRDGLVKRWPPKQYNRPVLLHGDFWPGNTMWKDGRFVSIIDWEDAGIGDPLSDLGNGRLEILMFFGKTAVAEFTQRYQFLMPDLDYGNLPYWDLCAALRPAGKMADWGLDEATLRKLQEGHKEFVDQALERLFL